MNCRTDARAEDERNISITLGSDGRLAIDDDVVNPSKCDAAHGAARQASGDGVLVVIRADSGVATRCRGLLDEARLANAPLAIATPGDGVLV